MSSAIQRVVAVAALIIGPWCSVVVAAEPTHTAQPARQASVEALLGALKRQSIEKGRNQEVVVAEIEAGLREAASLNAAGKKGDSARLIERLYQQAKLAIAGLQTPSQTKTGSAALDEAQQKQRLATDTPQLRATFSRREADVSALLQAGDRVAKEKGVRPPALAAAEAGLVKARAQAQRGAYADAVGLLELAYQEVKAGVTGLRSGDSVYAGKTFLSAAEEYQYEKMRNEDYQRLIAELLKSRTDASWSAIAEKCSTLRRDAENAAGLKHWDQALVSMLASTSDLKALLKQAGFPIM